MPKVICVANTKGGVGKTTTTANLSAALARSGKSVLMVDYDPQESLGEFFCVDTSSPDALTIKDLLLSKTANPNDAVINIGKNLDLIPCHFELRAFEQTFQKLEGGEKMLKAVIDRIDKRYDYIVIDTPASETIFFSQAAHAATDVLVPLKASNIDVKATVRFFELLSVSMDENPNLKLSGVVFTMVKSGAKTHEILKAKSFVGEVGEKVMKTTIRNTVQLETSSIKGEHIFNVQPKGIGAGDYMSLAEEVMTWA